jgi:hypothetical protein
MGTPNIVEQYTKQEMERQAFLIDKNFWLVVKEKPNWMPSFLYRAVIKNLVEFNEVRTHSESFLVNTDIKK